MLTAQRIEQFVMIRFHEIALKGKNRPFFIQQLSDNVEQALSGTGIEGVRPVHLMVLVRLGQASWPDVQQRLSRVLGVKRMFFAYRTAASMEAVAELLARILPQQQFSSFRISANRENKSFPKTSVEIQYELGSLVQQITGAAVNLLEPELNIKIDVSPREIYISLISQSDMPGPGGLPVGVSGKVACLLSGGIDSPVAAWLMMKRGCQAILVHFHGFPLTNRSSLDKALELAEVLTTYQYHTRLYLVPFSEVQKSIIMSIPPSYRVILYRRFMSRIAEVLAYREGAKALITGDSLGQVSSQTLDNLATVGAAVRLPILRPLIATDKEEIVKLARKLGTYDISVRPDQDCCRLFVPQHPATHSRADEMEKLEAKLDTDGLVQAALAQVELKEYHYPPQATRP
jgi:tRNA uracil 4-sulfurtransferase